ncbi:hypothetical protein J8273_6561 [Carpediemonas membranifera]|uniref:Uncharacterized protein n=1 Tax=Carpediemonas membranifera TaxID=201153 RepID=A0A8J6B7R9_9EUKA|nr:hypothetical protein J8273_6561 [Carpediemonas membranifera]|eukprot:KAG9391782.1 hypothetical protein J8273_6561 [Carpediemonas membranifera]
MHGEKDKTLAKFKKAIKFTKELHPTDLEWILSRTELVEDVDDFLEEYIYVVVASGFKGKIAASYSTKLAACDGDDGRMGEIFRNKAKTRAIADVYTRFKHGPDAAASWSSFRATLLDQGEDYLTTLPRIGPVVKSHLARNIGLVSVAKPDLHMIRLAAGLGWGTDRPAVEAMVAFSAGEVGMPVGATDFCMWVWLSHGGKEADCCRGKYRLR